MSIATLIRRMTELGCPNEAIALAVEEIEAVQSALDARRHADRDRKRAQREGQKSANVTGHSEDSPGQDVERVSLDKEKSPTPPKEINPIPCARGARTRDGFHRMPEGWRPAKPLPAELLAKITQWPPGAHEDEIASLKRWAANAADSAGKGRKKDWDKFYWNWIGRRHDEHYSRRASTSRQQPPGIGKTASAIAGLGDWHDQSPM
jgi:hypothetical protein